MQLNSVNQQIEIRIEEINLMFTFSFDVWSVPGLVKDSGAGTITVTNASINLNLNPQNDQGSLHIEFYDTEFNIADYDVQVTSKSDMGKAIEILLNNFKNFFKQELSNIIAWRMAKAVEDNINRNLIKSGKKVDIKNLGCRLNTTLTGEPVFLPNVIAFPLDGSFISTSQDDIIYSAGFNQMPVFIEKDPIS